MVRVDRRESSILAILSLGSRGSAPNAETKITDLKLGCAVQLASLATFFYPLVAGLVSGAGIGLSIVQELVRAHGGESRSRARWAQARCSGWSSPPAGRDLFTETTDSLHRFFTLIGDDLAKTNVDSTKGESDGFHHHSPDSGSRSGRVPDVPCRPR